MSAAASRTATNRFGQMSGEANSLHVIQGEQKISNDPNVVLTTILGSCVAACMRDPVAGVGGMNHFLLPGDNGASGVSGAAERFGVHAMELLVNALLEKGALRSRLEVKLFGGGKTINTMNDVGRLNADFAEGFLRRERITLVGECLRGLRGRRIQYWPVSGRARRIFLAASEAPAPRPVAPPPADVDFGSLDLF